jgi:hypothetical protein
MGNLRREILGNGAGLVPFGTGQIGLKARCVRVLGGKK